MRINCNLSKHEILANMLTVHRTHLLSEKVGPLGKTHMVLALCQYLRYVILSHLLHSLAKNPPTLRLAVIDGWLASSTSTTHIPGHAWGATELERASIVEFTRVLLSNKKTPCRQPSRRSSNYLILKKVSWTLERLKE